MLEKRKSIPSRDSRKREKPGSTAQASDSDHSWEQQSCWSGKMTGRSQMSPENCCSSEMFEVLILSNFCPVWILQLWLRDVLVRKWRERNKISAWKLNGPLQLTVQIKQLFFFGLFKDPVLLKSLHVLYLSRDTLRWAAGNRVHLL